MDRHGKLLKIYIGESDHHHGEPLYHEIKRGRSRGRYRNPRHRRVRGEQRHTQH